MEGEILEMNHGSRVIPGVVLVAEFRLVTREDEWVEEAAAKVCLELIDKSEPFIAIRKPRDAFVAIWDLLEGDSFTPHLRFCD